ncbi:MAG: restriction endonuclease subunit S [Candidatus Nanopelagicaceae bacterium]
MAENWGDRLLLDDVCTLITDGSHFSPPTCETGYPYITVRDVKEGKIDLSACARIDGASFEDLERTGCRPQVNDVLFSKDGTVGKVALVRTDVPFVVLSSLAILRADGLKIRPEYLAMVLSSPRFQEEAMGQKTGLAIKRVVLKNLRAMSILVPSFPIQRRIVDLMTHLDNHLGNLRTERDAAERLLKSARGHLIKPDETWASTKLGDIAEVFDGPHATPKKTSVGPWYLSISSLKQGRVDLVPSAHLNEDEYATWTRRVKPELGDVLFSYETRLGEAALWDQDDRAVLGRRMGLLRPKFEIILGEFLAQAYLSPSFQSEIEERAVRGSTVDRIPIAKMPDWPFPTPSLTVQREIVATISRVQAVSDSLELEVKKLLSLRAYLLMMLMHGNLIVDSDYDTLLTEVA